MYLMKLSCHRMLQELASTLTYCYRFHNHDPYVLRSAIVEVLQNTIQHSNGRFGLLLTGNSIVVSSLPVTSPHQGYKLGLRMYKGISLIRKGELFIARIHVGEVHMEPLNIEEIMNSPAFSCCY